MNVEHYLNRINYRGPRDVSTETLRELHKTHLLTVPFENLDVHLKRPIILDEEKLVAKILGKRRGGICYELNGAFCLLLCGLGFGVSMLSAGSRAMKVALIRRLITWRCWLSWKNVGSLTSGLAIRFANRFSSTFVASSIRTASHTGSWTKGNI